MNGDIKYNFNMNSDADIDTKMECCIGRVE